MMSVVVFIYALLSYMSSYMEEVRVRIGAETVRSSRAAWTSIASTHPLSDCREHEPSYVPKNHEVR